jgi:hypothetical protein
MTHHPANFRKIEKAKLRVPCMQKQDSMFAVVYSLCCETIIPGSHSPLIHGGVLLILYGRQELQSMNIAARLYTVSTGRVRDGT